MFLYTSYTSFKTKLNPLYVFSHTHPTKFIQNAIKKNQINHKPHLTANHSWKFNMHFFSIKFYSNNVKHVSTGARSFVSFESKFNADIISNEITRRKHLSSTTLFRTYTWKFVCRGHFEQVCTSMKCGNMAKCTLLYIPLYNLQGMSKWFSQLLRQNLYELARNNENS